MYPNEASTQVGNNNESGVKSDGDWIESNAPIPNFGFNSIKFGFQKTIHNDLFECFKLFWTQDILDIRDRQDLHHFSDLDCRS